jgi:hypothetical protein
VRRWGWVAEISGRAAGWAHPLEKSVPDLVDTSIHRLLLNRRILRIALPDIKFPVTANMRTLGDAPRFTDWHHGTMVERKGISLGLRSEGYAVARCNVQFLWIDCIT